jgi:hypothetical protein
MVTRCPRCRFAFKGRPTDYLQESQAARRLKRVALLIIFPVLLGVFVYLKFGAAWFGQPTAFTGMANALMLVMVSPSVLCYVIALRLPLMEHYHCRSCHWDSLAAAGAPARPLAPGALPPPLSGG